MRDHIGLFQSGMALIAAAIGIFGPGLASLRADVLGQAGTEITIEMGKAARLSAEEVHDRGIKLRAALDKAFNGLQDSGKAGHANEFSAIVPPYISAGMGLEDAESILRAAGFAEPPRPDARAEQPRSRTDCYAVVLAEYAGRRHRMMYYP